MAKPVFFGDLLRRLFFGALALLILFLFWFFAVFLLSIWNQKPRVNHKLHWDGNNAVLKERNIIAALGVVGRDFEALDYPRLKRITEYIMDLQPPKYEEMIPDDKYKINPELRKTGEGIYQEHCADCHDKRFGEVVAVEELGTDRNRVDAFTEALEGELKKVGPIFVMGGTEFWELRNFKKTNGYVNTLLDGLWLRAPYLHNGSVPTLRDLLNKPDQRPKEFYRGNDVYDWDNVGFKWDVPEQNGRT